MKFNEKTMTITVTMNDEDGNEYEQKFPAKFELCYQCEGKGKHVHSGVDGHGITQAEFSEDPDFREDYFNGNYDVRCDECHGKRVLPVIDYDSCSEAQKEALEKYERDEYENAQFKAECRAERRMGC